MKIVIGKYNIEVKDALSWFDAKQIESVMLSGAKVNMTATSGAEFSGIDGRVLFESKLKMFELVILKITEGEKTFSYSMDWLKGLSKEEGDLLDLTLDNLYSTQKKN